jgi:hypothetical protein
MGTVINMIRRAGSVLASLPVFHDVSFETRLSYIRRDNKQIEFTVVHLEQASGDNFHVPHLALSSTRLHNNPNGAPHALLQLSMEEARLLKDFLNHPEVSTWLDEEA